MSVRLNLLIIVLYFALTLNAKPLNPKKVLYAINCGSTSSSKSSLGFQYLKDQGYSDNTKVSDYSINDELGKIPVQYTFDQIVFKTERHSDHSFYYDIPLQNHGKYVLIAQFAEMWFRESNKRTFHLALGKKRVISNIDVVNQVGHAAALNQYIEFELREDNQIYFEGKVCNGAYFPESQKLRFYIEKGQQDLPSIQSFVLYDGSLEDTDYKDQDKLRQEWRQRLEEERRFQEEEKKRREEARRQIKESLGGDSLEFQEDQEPFLDGLVRVLQQKEGLFILGLLFSFLFFLFLFGKDPVIQKEKNN